MGISQVLLCIDITILIISGFVFGKKAVLYAIIMQMIYSKTISVVPVSYTHLVDGEENFGYSAREVLKERNNYDSEKDYDHLRCV